jgi:UDP:flavonoid glycosyltransferase YjiC (YdhE family)
MTRYLPIALCNVAFKCIRPAAFAMHTIPLNRIRKEYGLVSLGLDLRRIYTDADYVLYSDIPELVPLAGLPESHHYIGPIIWSPPTPIPEWWNEIPTDLPLVYVSLGSSGDAGLLPTIIATLSKLPIRAMVAAAGASLGGALPANVYMAAYLPGAEAARRASLVVCNGGSLTCQQALAAGVPILGVAGNLDQFLNMNAILSVGSGEIIRADRFNADDFGRIIRLMLGKASYAASAGTAKQWLARYPCSQRFADFCCSVRL